MDTNFSQAGMMDAIELALFERGVEALEQIAKHLELMESCASEAAELIRAHGLKARAEMQPTEVEAEVKLEARSQDRKNY